MYWCAYYACLSGQLLDAGVHGLHFFTLNLEQSVLKTLQNLGLTTGAGRRRLPWRASHATNRTEEKIRPIFWANRPKSYILRTQSWDSFPQGQWRGGWYVDAQLSLHTCIDQLACMDVGLRVVCMV